MVLLLATQETLDERFGEIFKYRTIEKVSPVSLNYFVRNYWELAQEPEKRREDAASEEKEGTKKVC